MRLFCKDHLRKKMGVDAMRIGVQMWKVMVFSIRTCYRSFCNHPFLMGFVCFMIFLYRSSPFMFSLLVSASPILICTSVLLGTLLSFGKTNIPEIEKGEKVTAHDIASLRTGVGEDTTVVKGDENESFATVESYVGKGRRDIVGNDLDETILVESRRIEVQEDDGLVDCMPFIDVNTREIQFEKEVVEKIERESHNLLALEKHREVPEEKPRIEGKLIDGEVLDNLDSKDEVENFVVEDDKSPGPLIDAPKEDQLDCAPGLSLVDALREDLLGSAPGSSLIDAVKEDQLGSAPGSSFINAVKEDQLGSAPGSSLIVLKEDHFASAPSSSLIKEDQLGTVPGFSWRRIEEDYGEIDGADGDESLDSGSDGSESSSPDASMADIIPMLDELHPLLELEAPQPARTSHDGSDTDSERLHESDDESVDSEDMDNQGGGEGEGEDDNDDDEEEEGEKEKGEKEDESKSAIKWTEVDQKNLMDLGTSELERNQRLENLIARRRARKNMRLMAEKNLIDLESSDLPFSIPPIATTRRNPFELPDDTYDNMAIPGSAPSILLPSRNPFDLPYDSNEEKPDLKGDSFQQEFSGFQHKEPVFRRNETFSIGPSVFGGSRHERQDFKWRPYFLPERFSSEGTGYPSFQRQLSEVSQESANSAVDEDRVPHEQVPEQFSSDGMSYATLQRQISDISESKASYVPDTESVSSDVDEEEKKLSEQDDYQETEVISNIDHGANNVQCESKSSGEVDSLDIEQSENRDVRHDEVITLGNVENHHENEPSSSGTEGTSPPQEVKANNSHMTTEPGEEYSRRSSYSLLSEVDENIPDVRKEEDLTNLEQKENVIEESGVSTHILTESSKFQFTSKVVEHREPLFDSSPPGMERFLSFTSISSDTQLEIFEMSSLPVLLESAAKDFEEHSEDTEKDSAEPQEAPTISVESIKEVNISSYENASENHHHGKKTLKNSSPLTSSSTSTRFESLQSRSPGAEEVNTVNNGNTFEIQDGEHKTQRNSSSLTSISSSTTPFESHEDQSPGAEDVKEDILDRVVNGDLGHGKEHFYNSMEAYDPRVNEENINEAADEIKEIEGLLSELDTVGDFSVKEVVGESFYIEPRPLENISATESLPNDSNPLETNLELPVLEAKSSQDIVFAFKQLDDGADVEVILSSMLENQVVPVHINSDLPVVEARSVEDIHAVLKQVSQSDVTDLPKPLESNDHSAEEEKREVVATEQIESSSDLAELPKPLESNDNSSEVEKREVVATEQIESFGDVHSGVQEDSATATDELKHVSKETSENSTLRISDGKENIINEDQVPAPIQTQAPVILTENENPKGA